MLLRQRVNEAARGVLVAFAQGSDLDHLAAFYPEKRLEGALATFAGKLTLAAPLGMDVTIPADYRIVAKNGAVEARLMEAVTIPGDKCSPFFSFIRIYLRNRICHCKNYWILIH